MHHLPTLSSAGVCGKMTAVVLAPRCATSRERLIDCNLAVGCGKVSYFVGFVDTAIEKCGIGLADAVGPGSSVSDPLINFRARKPGFLAS